MGELVNPMKRTELKRRTPLRAKAPPPRPVKTIEGYTPRPRAVAVAVRDESARMVVPVPKENALQHQGYMDLVRRMPCAHCGRRGPSQFCHADMDKGMGIKTDCRLGWPGCADRPGAVGCHTIVGSTGYFKREHRRHLEAAYGEKTRRAIFESGKWPPGLPYWPGDQSPTRREAAHTEG